MKVFITTVNSWGSLVVNTKISILVALGVLDSPLYEIKMSKLKKSISVKENITKYFVEIYLKMAQW